MEWRCAWCGKPHESDDPPCDNCGNHKFEKAVEQVAADGDSRGTVWVCSDCGRQHQKHSPPCSRCGNLTLEQRDVSELDDPLDDIGTGWRDVVEPRYVLGYLAVGALLLVLGLGAVGIVDLPGFGEPDVPDAPGEAETAGNLSLAEVERALVVALNERRGNASSEPLSTDETLGRIAAYVNKAIVAERYDGGSGPDSDALDRFDTGCSDPPSVLLDTSASVGRGTSAVAEDADPEAAASALVANLQDHPGFDQLLGAALDSVGVDVHVAPDDAVYVTVAVC